MVLLPHRANHLPSLTTQLSREVGLQAGDVCYWDKADVGELWL
jgi:hypothetical protein